ncbi:MAG: hypothetical protein JXX29_16800 [Deltaproteobacteria bacterium]|nr:hypothetical protein [Deltaproteobacteria bacterium]MBN2673345.1 hypothetical protein [Deltaproteobacteria bacterium]
MNEEYSFDEEETRVAMVHPSTGKESRPLSKNPQCSMDEATIACAPRLVSNPYSNKTTEEFIPLTHVLSSSEQTCVWKSKPNHLMQMLHRCRHVSHRKKAVIMVGIALLVSLLFVLPNVFESKVEKPLAPSIHFGESEQKKQRKPFSSPTKSEGQPSLHRAIRLLREGKLQHARQEYEQLSIQYPDSDSFAISVSILNAQENQL